MSKDKVKVKRLRHCPFIGRTCIHKRCMFWNDEELDCIMRVGLEIN